MTWELVASLIVKVGVPAAEAIVKKWEAGQAPTSSDFAELRALGEQDSVSVVKDILTAKGIDLESDQAKQLLALAK